MSVSSLYYHHKQPGKDWQLKQQIETVLEEHPSYGYRRVALALKHNKKRVQRVMRLFGIKAYRRRGRKRRRAAVSCGLMFPNLLRQTYPQHPDHIWVSDFTYLPYRNRFVYLATVMDVFSREVMGWSVQTRHGVVLVLHALFSALLHHSRPTIFHSDPEGGCGGTSALLITSA